MVEVLGYVVLSIISLGVIGVFVKVLVYALDAVNKNDN
jgi:hypothetical protein